MQLSNRQNVWIVQRKELAELFGFETRNKYVILSEDQQPIGYAAEQGKGLLGLLMRYIFGHWRRFEIQIFDNDRQLIMRAVHPFRWIFQRLEVVDAQGKFLGAVQQRFSILTKSFDVTGAQGQLLFEVRSPIWKIWTFPFDRQGVTAANVLKRWGGLIKEAFTDADRFLINYALPSMPEDERRLVLAAGLFIDLQFFERKANN